MLSLENIQIGNCKWKITGSKCQLVYLSIVVEKILQFKDVMEHMKKA